ncbi:MAG: FkbM family methyltransferase [Desulfosarcinaceae bacterium]|nr:FkbM family methyltransferase [Desulfosarcinaceae bacterium]
MPPKPSKKIRKRRRLRLKTYLRAYGPKGLLLFIRELGGDRAQATLRRRELRHPLHLRLNTPDILVYREIIERHEYRFDVSSEVRSIIDAGANIGLASIYFAHRFPHATILALEPEAENFAQLQKNTAAYPQITPLKAALWHRKAAIEIYSRHTGSLGFSIHNTDGCERSAETVDALGVPDLMDRFHLTGIDLLKIDIEGAEKSVFDHSQEWIDHVGIIVAEMHDRITMGCSRAFYTAISGFPVDFQLNQNLVAMRSRFAATDPVY